VIPTQLVPKSFALLVHSERQCCHDRLNTGQWQRKRSNRSSGICPSNFRAVSIPARYSLLISNPSNISGQSRHTASWHPMSFLSVSGGRASSAVPILAPDKSRRRLTALQDKLCTCKKPLETQVVPTAAQRALSEIVCRLLKGLEARAGIEPAHKGFADLSLTTWVPRLGLPASWVADRPKPLSTQRKSSGAMRNGAGDET
jgi:hypothetical protein